MKLTLMECVSVSRETFYSRSCRRGSFWNASTPFLLLLRWASTPFTPSV